MKTLNAKRISAVAVGAALLGIGLAFAGQITFQNVPIITASGQPAVQIVIGSQAKPSDGVAAANIAAAIGNLAYASVPVTASVNQTQAASVLKAQVSSASYTLNNVQVWLNATGAGTAAGTYGFQAVIGSVINRGILLSAPDKTKSLQTGAGTQYAYPDTSTMNLQASPEASAYSASGPPPIGLNPVSNYDGGGVSFQQFNNAGQDNILHITQSSFPALLNNYGGYGESTSLWVSGFPVYDQQSGVNSFTLMSAGGAYEAIFNKPIQNRTSSNSPQINAPIQLLGTNWTIVNESSSQTTSASQTQAVAAGYATLASSLAPLTTVYVGKNISAGGFTVQLTDLGQPNSNGVSTASLNIWYGNTLTNTTSVSPGSTTQINVTGHKLFINVNNTFAGLYAYQKWAKMRLYANLFTITNGQQFNKTTNPGWNINLLWTNTTSSSAAKDNALYGIVIYNTTPVHTLLPGQSFTYAEQPAKYKLTFIGETLGTAGFDPVTIVPSQSSSLTYQNQAGAATHGAPSITNLTSEPGQLLTVSSQIPGAFTAAGVSSSSIQYLLTPYQLAETWNVATANTLGDTANQIASNVVLSYTGPNGANWISANNPLTVTIKGWELTTASSETPASSSGWGVTQTATFQGSNTANLLVGTPFWNVTSIQISRSLPGAISISVYPLSSIKSDLANNNALATFSNTGPAVLYTSPGQTQYQYLSQTAISNTIYNQLQGQTTVPFVLATVNPVYTTTAPQEYFTYTMNEVAVTTQPTSYQDQIGVGIYNSTVGTAATSVFYVNYTSTGSGHNNVTYVSTVAGGTGGSLAAASTTLTQGTGVGFRTERGSKVASITPQSVTINFAKSVDTLSFGISTNGTSVSTNYKLYGPYGVGQAVSGIPTVSNVSIGPVTANIVVAAGASFTIAGIGSIVATPSVSKADTPVWLKNLSSTAPLVILDSNANQGSNLILIGSGFVNTLSGTLQSAQNITMSPSTSLLQAYGNKILVAGFYANQTTAQANNFINALYAQATT